MKIRKHVLGAVASVCIAAVGSFATPSTVYAADGCKFLLCIAGPWRSIAECRPTVLEVFRDLAKGRPFPGCAMSGGGNSAWNSWNSEQSCPIMYRRYGEFGYEGCQYTGQITVQMEGQLWSTVYWNFDGDTSTLWTDKAKQSLTQPGAAPMDNTYDNDLAAWNKAHEPKCNGWSWDWACRNQSRFGR